MRKSIYCLIVTALSVASVGVPQGVVAQVSPPIIDMCSYRESRCRRDDYGNIVDRKTGSVYDRKGNLIQRGNGRRDDPKKCKYVTDDRCSLYNNNCRERWYWKCRS
jgi:hypothetical protein